MNFSAEEAQAAYDQLEALDVDDAAAAQSVSPGAATGITTQSKVCGIYQHARPFLLLVTTLFFIPQKWQNTIRTFTQTMDLLCSGNLQGVTDVSEMGNVNKV